MGDKSLFVVGMDIGYWILDVDLVTAYFQVTGNHKFRYFMNFQ